MSRTLVIALAVDSGLDSGVGEAVAAAASLGSPVVLGIVAANPEAVAAAGSFAGVAEIVGVKMPAGATPGTFDLSAARALFAEVKPTIAIAGFDARAAAFAGTLAAELGLAFACNAVMLSAGPDGIVATRTLYGGKVHADVRLDPAVPALILIRPSAWAAAAAAPSLPCQTIEAGLADARIRHVSFVPAPTSGYDLTRQDAILAVGRGVGTKENIAAFAEIAGKLGAALAASRPLVDAGWLPRDHQVGRSGVSVAPRVYLAFGIPGALQQVAGIRGAGTVIAVNSDTDAPIFASADYGAAVDMFELADELKKQLT